MRNILKILSAFILLGSFSAYGYVSIPDRQLIQYQNLLSNGGGENGKYGWAATNGTDSVDAANAFEGKSSLKLSMTAQQGQVDYIVTPGSNGVPAMQTNSVNMEAFCRVNTTQTTIQVCGLAGGNEQNCQNVPSSGTWQPVSANFIGPSNGTSVGVRVKSTSSITGTFNRDSCYVGPARNLSQVSQAQFIGSVQITGCAGRWSTSATSFSDYSAQTGCSYAVSAGSSGISAPASQLPGFNLTGGPGTYEITYVGLIGQQNGTADGNPALFKLTDGTNVATEFPGFNGSGSIDSSGGVGIWHITYTTAPTNVFIRVQGAASAASGDASIYGMSTFPGVFLVKFFPSQASLAVSASQQWQPTVTKLLSGSGTYTVPNGVSRIEVKMVGAGGGGAGSGTSGGGGAGGAGGNTTFGTSLLTANGGAGGTNSGSIGGAGGSGSLSAPAVGFAVSGGGGGGGALNPSTSAITAGGVGGSSFFGGGGAGGSNSGASAGATNTGGGGGGGGTSTVSLDYSGSGGGSGGYVDAIIPFPSASYSYSVGTAGIAGTAGTSGFAGGPGGSGAIYVTEYYYAANAPQFPGQITSNSTNQQFRLESATVNCITGTCSTLTQSSGWFTGATWSSAGVYNLAWSSSTWSSAPTCIFTSYSCASGNCLVGVQNVPGTSGVNTVVQTQTGGTLTNGEFGLMCMGPR